MGPHADHETELLAAGLKPIGLFSYPNDKMLDIDPNYNERVKSEIAKLSALAETGQLGHANFTLQLDDGRQQFWHYYCQLSHYEEMLELMQLTKAAIAGDLEAFSNRDQGKFFGYRACDIKLFHRGGYHSFREPIRSILIATHDYRKRAYIEMLIDGSNNTSNSEKSFPSVRDLGLE